MSSLTFTQKTVIDLYSLFYGESYFDQLETEETTKVHVKAQKMCYLLKKKGVEVGDYGYSWNFHGPFSPGLLALLHSIESQEEEGRRYGENAKSTSSFSQTGKSKIDTLIQELHLANHKSDRGEWMELLGSLSFLSNSVLPGEGYDSVVAELMKRKPHFDNDTLNRDAWETLKAAGLLTIYN